MRGRCRRQVRLPGCQQVRPTETVPSQLHWLLRSPTSLHQGRPQRCHRATEPSRRSDDRDSRVDVVILKVSSLCIGVTLEVVTGKIITYSQDGEEMFCHPVREIQSLASTAHNKPGFVYVHRVRSNQVSLTQTTIALVIIIICSDQGEFQDQMLPLPLGFI